MYRLARWRLLKLHAAWRSIILWLIQMPDETRSSFNAALSGGGQGGTSDRQTAP